MKTAVLLAYFTLLCVIRAHTQIDFADNDFNSIQATSSDSWDQPVGVVFSKTGDRLFVWEKAGKVYVCNRVGGNYIRQDDPVLDISEEVGNYNDFGLTGFALDPAFDINGKIYLSYVVDRYYLLNKGKPSYNPIAANLDKFGATIGRISRFQTSENGSGVLSADVSTRFVLLGDTKKTGVPILHLSHGTGSLVFAADGTLLASMGDGASFNVADQGSLSGTYFQQGLNDTIIRPDENVGAWRSQKLTSLSGKLLRIDPVFGNGIASNPFYEESAPGSIKSRIWAMGFRNPFRMSIRPGQGSVNPSEGHLGEIFVGEVGFGRWEELNIVKEKGMNFGWPRYEGLTIGVTYIGGGDEGNIELPLPPEEPCNGRTPALVRFNEQLIQDNAAKDTRIYYPCNSTVLLGDDIHYMHSRPVLDWVHAGENWGPKARVGIFKPNGEADTALIGTAASNVEGTVFNGNASTGGIWYTGAAQTFPAEYANTFLLGDYGGRWIRRITLVNNQVTKVDSFATNTTVVCMAENPMDGSVVYVDYGDGTTGTAKINKITFGGNKPPIAILKVDGNYYSQSSSLNVKFDGTESYDQDGTIAIYAWDFGDGVTSTGTDAKPNHVFSSGVPQMFTVKLKVTDNDGASDSTEFIVSVNNTPPVVNIIKPVKDSKYQVGGDSTLLCQAIVSDPESNVSEYEWQTILVHDTHTHPEPTSNDIQPTTEIQRLGCMGVDYHWLIRLKVTDDAGLFTIDSSEIYPNCTGALPIVLHKFSVTQNGATNLVKWTTELESNIEYFEVERSTDGIHFFTINRQEASNAPGPNHYSFPDNQFLPGVNYYRLKIVEHGSVIRYSVIVRTVAEGEANIIKVVPNPVVGNFSLTYLSREKDRITIQIRDIAGRLLHTLKEDVNKGQNVIYMQNLPNWNSGVYFISVQNKDEVKQVKFIKAR